MFLCWLQEAYIRGVSGWNFDVAALKRSANEEGPALERLSTIAETPGQNLNTGLGATAWADIHVTQSIHRGL